MLTLAGWLFLKVFPVVFALSVTEIVLFFIFLNYAKVYARLDFFLPDWSFSFFNWIWKLILLMEGEYDLGSNKKLFLGL